MKENWCYESLLVEQSRVLRWFGGMERMEEDWLVKRIIGSDVRSGRLSGRTRIRWMDSVIKEY